MSSACSGLSKKCIKKSPSLCQSVNDLGSSSSSALYSGLPKLGMKLSLQSLHHSAILSSPPTSSHMADQAFGANSLADMTLWPGMLIFSVVHVDLSFGDMPSLGHIELVKASDASLVKHCGILR